MVDVTARRLSASALIALALGGPGAGSLQRVAPGRLRPVGHAVRVPNAMLGYAWARRGSTLALVVKPVATGQPIRIFDARSLRLRRRIRVGDRDVCGLTFAGPALVALASDRPCYWSGGRFSLLRIDPARGIVSTVPVHGLRTVFPTNLAFGDGHAYVIRGDTIDAVDLRTGTVREHRPRRSLAKGTGIVFARWLGDHRLGAGGGIVDVSTWRRRTLLAGARGVAGGAHDLVAWGDHGASLYTRSGRLRLHVLPTTQIVDAHVVGRTLYVYDDAATTVVDLVSGRTLRVVPAPTGPWLLLAP
jgi:hypothetical protein